MEEASRDDGAQINDIIRMVLSLSMKTPKQTVMKALNNLESSITRGHIKSTHKSVHAILHMLVFLLNFDTFDVIHAVLKNFVTLLRKGFVIKDEIVRLFLPQMFISYRMSTYARSSVKAMFSRISSYLPVQPTLDVIHKAIEAKDTFIMASAANLLIKFYWCQENNVSNEDLVTSTKVLFEKSNEDTFASQIALDCIRLLMQSLQGDRVRLMFSTIKAEIEKATRRN